MQKNILITGGAGFIGSHLCDALVDTHNVICIDDFTGGNEENIEHLLPHPNFVLLKHDINDPIDLERVPELKKFKVKGLGISEIYHLALPTSPKNFSKLRRAILYTNSVGTLNVLEIARRYKSKFFLTSSSVVYGPRPADNERIEESEFGSVDMLSERACYDEGKRFAETAAATYRDLDGIDVKIARLGRVYGPRMPINEGHMIPDFILAALAGAPLIIHGDEQFSTAMLYISDCINALTRFMNAPKNVGPFNIAADENHKIVDVAKMVIQLVGSSSKVKFEDPMLFMTPLALLDIHQAKEALEWLPLTRLEDGLVKTIEYTKATKSLVRKY